MYTSTYRALPSCSCLCLCPSVAPCQLQSCFFPSFALMLSSPFLYSISLPFPFFCHSSFSRSVLRAGLPCFSLSHSFFSAIFFFLLILSYVYLTSTYPQFLTTSASWFSVSSCMHRSAFLSCFQFCVCVCLALRVLCLVFKYCIGSSWINLARISLLNRCFIQMC